MDKLPWAELTGLQKREAIALRLGWMWSPTTDGGMFLHFDRKSNMGCSPDMLPHWPTNDGLAFVEVWPKISPGLSLSQDDGGDPGVWDCVKERWIVVADTWADAICHAAYELLPLSAC